MHMNMYGAIINDGLLEAILGTAGYRKFREEMGEMSESSKDEILRGKQIVHTYEVDGQQYEVLDNKR